MIYDFLSKFGPVSDTQTSESCDIRDLHFKYLGLYFTAEWCSSCVRTSEGLKKMVSRINSAHPGLFKMITIRLDEGNSNLGYSYWKFPEIKISGAE